MATLGSTAATQVSHRRDHESFTAYLFAAPWILGFLVFTLFPFLASIYWSFCQYDLLSPPSFTGMANYARIANELKSGSGVALALWNTAYFAMLSVPLSVVVGITLAIILNWEFPGRSWARALCYLPSIVPIVASSVLWMWLLDPRQGIVNRILAVIGIPQPGWFTDYREAAWLPGWLTGTAGVGSKDAMVLIALWGIGNTMMIYLAALGGVPRDLHEAAALDGAGRGRRFWLITLPLLTPVILFNLVMGLIQSVQVFTQMYVISEGTGAPERSLLVLSLHLFLSAFQDFDMGYASAIAWMVFALLVIATATLFRSARYWVHYEGAVH